MRQTLFYIQLTYPDNNHPGSIWDCQKHMDDNAELNLFFAICVWVTGILMQMFFILIIVIIIISSGGGDSRLLPLVLRCSLSNMQVVKSTMLTAKSICPTFNLTY